MGVAIPNCRQIVATIQASAVAKKSCGAESLSLRYTSENQDTEDNALYTLFFWDVLFGSPHITRKYPASVGLKDDRLFGQERWYHPMFYPFLQSRRDHTALKLGWRAYAEAATTSDSASDALAVKRA